MKIKIFAAIISLLAIVNAYGLLSQDEILHPDEAFKVSAEILEDNIQVKWAIEDGYYLYKEKFGFSVETPEATLGAPELPAGKYKKDKYLGEVHVHHDDVLATIPYQTTAAIPELTLKVSYQGCAEAGLCFPPQHKKLTLSLPKPAVPESITKTAKPAAGISNLAQNLGITSIGSNEPLAPDEAFKYFVSNEGSSITAFWKVTPGHYLYKEKITFAIDEGSTAKLGTPIFPTAKLKKDEYLGDTMVYEEDFSVTVPVISGEKGDFTLISRYQGCSEITGICYSPQKKKNTLTLSSLVAAVDTSAQTVTTSTTDATSQVTADSKPAESEQDVLFNEIKNGSLIGIILLFLALGLGLAFTPCVFPMIPILSGIIAGQGNTITTKKAFLLSVAYVLPMALVYAVVGVIAGLSGANLQIMFQNPWVISSFAALFVLLSLAMFGFYELQMPASIQSKLNDFSNKQESGSYIGAAIMGVLSALIVGPCVTAPLIAALTYIAQTGDAVLGGLALFALGLGMGIPLILIGTSAGKLLPKAGAWMNATKAVFGVLMIGLAIWMLERILPFEIIMLLSAILIIVSAVYMKAVSALPEGTSPWNYLWKGLGIILLIYGIILMLGVAAGSKSMLQPLKGIVGVSSSATANTAASHLVFKRVRTLAELDQAVLNAKQNKQTVMLDFYADWCISCKEMEHTTFKDPQVVQALSKTVLLQADVTDNNDDDKALMKRFGLFGPPGIMFYDTQGKEHEDYRLVGDIKAEKFLGHVNGFLKNHAGS
ncbi:MAG: Cytochrome c-type biogenesis protein DsbD, protein-disulfide reductase (EC [uncultured Thiotrichaceae bacterium]|uniref:Thiol:disulfide interchange protein DsbD n=1 Tax=uncultured Thiotrichaceae bacterium TaxID=298394 RepID=A0A6S6UG55_9GAMM|nr:MAG: Cytochrome c-type biogenesis protein DsbD, protein-disulfide reductase (EC [uncultured Thiotrichaceae bacterium]